MAMKGSMKKVLQGDLDNLPPVTSQVVRIFISSTFTDTREERNYLMETTYPKLKDYCKQNHGLEFQVVDMRWGVREEAADDHSASQLCMQEIKTCQQLSTGPTFVTFLGQRHGSRPFPPVIPKQHYEEIYKILTDHDKPRELLNQWFKEDSNSCPPMYVLQPVSTFLPDFLSSSAEKRQSARKYWSTIYSEIAALLRFAVSRSDAMTEKEKKKYFMSVTEEEVGEGLLQTTNPERHCICFMREIRDIDLHHPLAWRFIDLTETGEIDKDVFDMVEELKTKVQTVQDLKKNNATVTWSQKGGISPDEHKEYLHHLGEQFYLTTTNLIKEAISKRDDLQNNETFSEVLQHLHLARERCQIFKGREEILLKVKDCVTVSSMNPIVLYGYSGCGKTSIMAKTSQMIKDWIPNGKNANIVIRFLGTSPMSSGIHQTVTSICQQLRYLYPSGENEEIPPDYNEVLQFFQAKLLNIPESTPLVLILDSLDQLTAANYAHKVSLLQQNVPANVYVIVSTLPHMYKILDNLKGKCGEQNMIRVPNLEDSLCLDILKSHLNNESRTLTDEQFSLVREAFTKCSLPLYVRLTTDEVLLWKSYHEKEQTILAFTVKDMILNLFQRIEKKHGLTLVKHALAYISASKQGLSETELEDLLSLDDTVLSDVYQFHIPPVRRIPPLLWVRIKHDISAYLVTRENDSIFVTYWYHRQFIETSRERYLQDPSFAHVIYSSLVEYYDGIWYGMKKPFEYTAEQVAKLKLESPLAEADRKVMEQPLSYSDGKDIRYNTRKLNCLPFHLSQMENVVQLKRCCLFNYSWMLAKIEACGVNAVLTDINMVGKDEESLLLGNALNLVKSTIRQHAKSLCIELVGRLLPFSTDEYPMIQQLVKQCIIEGCEHNVIVPKCQCYPSPGGMLKYTLENSHLNPMDKLLFMNTGSKNLLALNDQNQLIMWDLENGELEKQIPVYSKSEPKLNVCKEVYILASANLKRLSSRNNRTGQKGNMYRKYLLLASAFQKDSNPVVLVDAEQGIVIRSIELEVIYDKIGFKDNLYVDLVGNKVIWHVKGKDVDVFDVETGKKLHSLGIQAQNAQLMHQGLLVHEKGTTNISLYDLVSLKVKTTLVLSHIPAGYLFADDKITCYLSYKESNTIDVIDTEKNVTRLCTIDFTKYIEDRPKSLNLSSDGSFLIIASQDKILLWNLKSNKAKCTLHIPNEIKVQHDHNVQSIFGVMYPDSNTLVVAREQILLFYEVKSGKFIRSFKGAIGTAINRIMVTDDCSMLITSAERNRMIKVWDNQKADQPVHSPVAMSFTARYVISDALSSRLVVRSHASETCVIDAKTCKILSYPSQEFEVMYPYISDDGEYIALRETSSQQCIKVWHAESGMLQCVIPVSSQSLQTRIFSSNSRYLATQSETSPTEDVALQLWDARSGAHILDFDTTTGGISFMFFARSDELFVTQQQYPQVNEGRDCKIHIYDVKTGNHVFTKSSILKDSLYIQPPDGATIIAVETRKSGDSLIFLNTTDFSIMKSFSIVPKGRLSFNSDGSRAIDTGLKVYDLCNGNTLCHFQEWESGINRNGFTWPKLSPTGKFAVWLIVRECLLMVGNVDSGNLVGKCFMHSIPQSLAVTRDNTIAVGNDEGHVMMFCLVDPSEDDPKQLYDHVLHVQKSRLVQKGTDSRGKSTKRSKMCQLL